MASNNVSKLPPLPSLPSTREGLMAMRNNPPLSNLNDRVDVYFIDLLLSNPRFAELAQARIDAEAQEGSKRGNLYAMAWMVRQAALDAHDRIVGDFDNTNLDMIKHALVICCNRQKIGKVLANVLHGEQVPVEPGDENGHNDNDE